MPKYFGLRVVIKRFTVIVAVDSSLNKEILNNERGDFCEAD